MIFEKTNRDLFKMPKFNFRSKKYRKPLVFFFRLDYNKTVSNGGFDGCRERSFAVNNEQTMTFSVCDDREGEMKKNLTVIYDALRQKGYNPVNQIVGYILSEDPTYITTYNNARSLIRHIDRDELLQVLVRSYLQG